jgi:hypothetical protein
MLDLETPLTHYWPASSPDPALAIKSYERALELAPNSNHVKAQLAKLRSSDTKTEAAH